LKHVMHIKIECECLRKIIFRVMEHSGSITRLFYKRFNDLQSLCVLTLYNNHLIN
jgi:hypothetical protein